MKHSLFKRLGLGLALAGLVSTSALAQADARPTVTVAVQQLSVFGVLSPVREYSNVALREYYSFLEPLVEYERQKPDLPVKPGLATSWKRVDARTVELALRRGVIFHNGDEMTAEDVAFTFGPEHMFGKGDANATGEGREPPAAAVANIKSLWPSLEKVEAVDKYTVRFINKEPDFTMEGRLSRIGSEIISKRAFLETPNWNAWSRKPVGTGPFKVVEFKQDNILLLEAHDAYWGGKPSARQLRFVVVPEIGSRVNGMLSGEYDFITDLPPDQVKTITANSKYEVVGGPVTNHRLIAFNKNFPALKDPRVRLAMSLAIDRKLIADTLFDGRVAIPKGLQWDYFGSMLAKDWESIGYDPARAKALLAEAGYKGEPISYRALAFNYYTNQVPVSQIMTEMWRAVGLNVVLEMKENWGGVLGETPTRGLRDWSNSAPYNDPVSSIVSQHCPRGQQQQFGEWANDEFNRLCELLEKSSDMPERQKAFRRMLEIAERDDPAYVVLYQTTLLYGKRKDIQWMWSGLQSMDFRAENLKFTRLP